MRTLIVYADFNWLNDIELVGELTMDSIRGSENAKKCSQDAIRRS